MNFSAVEATGAEVRAGTRTTITCTISNVLLNGVSVTWKDGDSTLDRIIDTSSVAEKEQISTLIVENPGSDKVYTCVIRSNSYTESQAYTELIELEVYGMFKIDILNLALFNFEDCEQLQ